MAAPGVKLIDLVPPKELAFEFHASTPNERKLTITNTHDSEIAFKVKTTAPKAYLVKPSNDLLAKGASVDIQILLQPGLAPGQGDNTPHRFLVQAALPVNGGVNLTKTEWAALRKEQIHEIRLSVVEDPPKDGGAAGAAAPKPDQKAVGKSIAAEQQLGGAPVQGRELMSAATVQHHQNKAPAATGPAAPADSDLQQKYEELIKYTVQLEKETLGLQSERDQLEAKVGNARADFGFALWHIILAVVLAMGLSKLPQYL